MRIFRMAYSNNCHVNSILNKYSRRRIHKELCMFSSAEVFMRSRKDYIVGIELVFASGAVVGPATTSVWWRAQPRPLTQKRGLFPFYHDPLDRSNQTM